MALPDGMKSSDFELALREFKTVVGEEWVFSSDADTALYDDSFSPYAAEPQLQIHASGAVSPTTVEQVQAIVRTANKYKLPLYAISTGRNLGYGGSAPVHPGSFVVDLKRMNRVLEVNEQEAYMLVEPGVSFLQLRKYFDDHNLPFMCSTPEPGWGSPIGNALDHGCSNVVGDNFGMVNGMEVVLPNGEVLRTGMGAVPTSRLWQNYRYGFGPVYDGFFSQANFGIVTKMGFWLIRWPDLQQSFAVTSPKSDDLHPMVDAIQRMREQGLVFFSGCGSPIRENMNTNNGHTPGNIPEVNRLLLQRDGGSPTQWESLAASHNMPVSAVFGAVRGPEVVVKSVLVHARDTFAKIPGVTFREGRAFKFPLDPNTVDTYERPHIGFPDLWAFSQPAVQGTSFGHYYFSPMFKATAQDVLDVNQTVRQTMLDAGDEEMVKHFGFSGGVGFYPKAYMILLEILIRNDASVNKKRRDLFVRLAQACGARGWAEYRTAPAMQDTVMAQYSYNNHALRRFSESIKDAIDPNGIIMPGKSGIWPKHLRKS
jgi:(+)-pinoresinol hydroxylase